MPWGKRPPSMRPESRGRGVAVLADSNKSLSYASLTPLLLGRPRELWQAAEARAAEEIVARQAAEEDSGFWKRSWIGFGRTERVLERLWLRSDSRLDRLPWL